VATVAAQSPLSCPACAESTAKFIGTKNDSRLYRCRQCGTIYTDRPAQDYVYYYEADNLAVPGVLHQRLDSLFEELGADRQTNRLLDLGCGGGSWLQAARRAGWEAEGLEVSEAAAEHVRALGFEVFCGDLFQANYPANRFDVVVAIELIEHLAEPLEILRETARILRPGGLLWATTPNADGLSARALGADWSTVSPPEHIQLFTLEGILRLTKRAGFSRVRVRSRGCNPLEIWHTLRNRTRTSSSSPVGKAPESEVKSFNRVASSYQLNRYMLGNPVLRTVKSVANGALGFTGLGDTLRIGAIK
jgi:2-polyprenyl-3-methyl-5-hydroxy-6-metoxy-1,4-benzoquinol methylase